MIGQVKTVENLLMEKQEIFYIQKYCPECKII